MDHGGIHTGSKLLYPFAGMGYVSFSKNLWPGNYRPDQDPQMDGTIRNRPGRPRAEDRISREKVLAAAREVFSRNPYKAASMRMIGEAGGFEHPLIHYYYKNKADLFEAVMESVLAELFSANLEWFEGLDWQEPEKALPLYVDRIISYDRQNPEPFKIIFLNMASVEQADQVPGMSLIPGVIAAAKQTCEQYLPLPDGKAHDMVNSVFINLLINYLGASFCQGQVFGMDPDSDAYRQVVKNTLLALFTPWARKLMAGPHSRG